MPVEHVLKMHYKYIEKILKICYNDIEVKTIVDFVSYFYNTSKNSYFVVKQQLF